MLEDPHPGGDACEIAGPVVDLVVVASFLEAPVNGGGILFRRQMGRGVHVDQQIVTRVGVVPGALDFLRLLEFGRPVPVRRLGGWRAVAGA